MTNDTDGDDEPSPASKGQSIQLLAVAVLLAACLGFAAGAYVASNTNRLSSLLRDRRVVPRFYKDAAGHERWRAEHKSEFLVELDKKMLQPPDHMPSGAWVLLLAGAWSGPDLQMIDTASQAADELGGDFMVGVVICDIFADTQAMLESHGVDISDFPVWLVVIDGKICGKASGYLSTSNVVALARQSSVRVHGN